MPPDLQSGDFHSVRQSWYACFTIMHNTHVTFWNEKGASQLHDPTLIVTFEYCTSCIHWNFPKRSDHYLHICYLSSPHQMHTYRKQTSSNHDCPARFHLWQRPSTSTIAATLFFVISKLQNGWDKWALVEKYCMDPDTQGKLLHVDDFFLLS